MKKFYYYARLNDNNVCVEIVSSVYKYPKDIKGYVELPEYNETVRYKKWLGDQWSTETYEPEVDTVVQDKLIQLEEENANLKTNVQTLVTENADLKIRVADLEEVIASSVGGAI